MSSPSLASTSPAKPAWVIESVRRLRAGLSVGHMARVRTAEFVGVPRAALEALQAEVV